jgi:hypothetical protein
MAGAALKQEGLPEGSPLLYVLARSHRSACCHLHIAQRRPVSARAITSRWISLVPS